MLNDIGLDHHDLIERGVGDLRAVAAVDRTRRQMEQEIEDTGAAFALISQFIEQFADFRPDAGQVRRRGKQRIGIEGRIGLI